jgi:hypothetical protein
MILFVQNLIAPGVPPRPPKREKYTIVSYSFLGNEHRNFYGAGIPKELKHIARYNLGSGLTFNNNKFERWSGAGWTGQPTIVEVDRNPYLIIGSFDHHLRKLDLNALIMNKPRNEVEIWKYKYDDIIKGSSTVFYNELEENAVNKIVVVQGSRRGIHNYNKMRNTCAYSLRAVSFETGLELWRFNVPKTESYSRDNDSSPIYLKNGLIFNTAENGIGYLLDSKNLVKDKNGYYQPKILLELVLYNKRDVQNHFRNIIIDSSPSKYLNKIYTGTGSGHIYEIDINSWEKTWDFFIDADIDGSTVINKNGSIFATLEKQYISGKGGVIKTIPITSSKFNRKKRNSNIEWYLPTGNKRLGYWRGGIIGSVVINDLYKSDDFPALFATNAVDGYLYIGYQEKVENNRKVWGPQKKIKYKTPRLVFKKYIGGSISTPIFTEGNRLITTGYNGKVVLFSLTLNPEFDINNHNSQEVLVQEIDSFSPAPHSTFESTPVIYNGYTIICCRDGNLYVLGSHYPGSFY